MRHKSGLMHSYSYTLKFNIVEILCFHNGELILFLDHVTCIKKLKCSLLKY